MKCDKFFKTKILSLRNSMIYKRYGSAKFNSNVNNMKNNSQILKESCFQSQISTKINQPLINSTQKNYSQTLSFL